MLFLVKVNDNLTGKPLSVKLEAYHPSLDKVIAAIDALAELTAQFPPVTMGQRYGNPSYRQWHAEMEKVCGPVECVSFIMLFLHFLFVL